MVPVDRFGRSFPYLRLSLTEVCNFRCSYCLPDGYRGDNRAAFLTLDEARRLVRAFATLGTRKVRLTGGEPSLRRDLTPVIAALSAVPGIQQIALTTNGYVLPRYVRNWREAGLRALNVSLDSLQPARFRAITGHDRHAAVTSGIEQALALGFDAVKVNVVLLKGLNDDELPAWKTYLRERDVAVRFIELMRTGTNHAYFQRHHLRAESLQRQLQSDGWQLQSRSADSGPANHYAHPDYRGRVGIIAPYSSGFCANCNRLRITARGELRLCLFGETGTPLKPLLQSDDDHDVLVGRIADQLGLKAAGHRLREGMTGQTPHLASIGG